MILAFVLLGFLALSVLFNIGTLLSGLLRAGTPTGGARLDEVVVEDSRSSSKIVIIPVEGIISGDKTESGGISKVDLIKTQLKRAKEDRDVEAVILRVDSPGGEALASDEIYRLIMDFQKGAHGKPVIASMGGLAASGGYYVSAPCRWIVANEMTITGSIGVIMQFWNYRQLADKIGLVPNTYKSGKHKDMLSGSREPGEVDPEENQMVQTLIQKTFSRFTNVVQQGRSWANQSNSGSRSGRKLADNWQEYADGRVLAASEALQLGLVDELGDFQAAVSRAKSIARLSDATLVEYRHRHDFSDLFRLSQQPEGRVLKIDIGMETPKLRTGRPYFLMSSFAP
jgi:protease IV